MNLNWIGYYLKADGYGRFSSHMIEALERQGATVAALTSDNIESPPWLHQRWGADWNNLTISCMAPYRLQVVPGRQWVYTMTEGSELPNDWAAMIQEAKIERVIVPCDANARAFRAAGVPVHVIHGGTDPDEFPVRAPRRRADRPYTLMTLADRATRKGWMEAWNGFYKAFGGAVTGQQDVRLIVKCLPNGNDDIDSLAVADNRDPRVSFDIAEYGNPYDIYSQADVVVIPSRSEGWGMPHREAAMMGVPVITQQYSGMDDGHTAEWAYVVGGQLAPIPADGDNIKGEWQRADVGQLALAMRHCYEHPEVAIQKGIHAAQWLRENQTWLHSSTALLRLIREYTVPQPAGRTVESVMARARLAATGD